MPWRHVAFLLHLSRLRQLASAPIEGDPSAQSKSCEVEACLGRSLEEAEALETRSLKFELLQKVLARSQHSEGNAIQASTEECNLCVGDHRWVFIISSGRTGSTSVLEMLNAIPQFYIAGENFGLMQHVQDLYQNDDMQTIMAGENYSTGAFYHKPISSNSVRCALQSYVKAMLGSFNETTTSVVGFKEIRHHTAEELDFFLELFPCARFVINTRADTEALHESQSKAFSDAMPAEELQSITDVLETWQATHSKETFLLRLEDFSLERFNEMLAFLGVTDCKYTSIAEDNIKGYYPGLSRAKIAGKCKVSMSV